MKIICKLPIPHNILALTNPSLLYHLKLCAAFSVFVTETQVDSEKSPISKKITSIISRSQCPASSVHGVKFKKDSGLFSPLLFCAVLGLLLFFCLAMWSDLLLAWSLIETPFKEPCGLHSQYQPVPNFLTPKFQAIIIKNRKFKKYTLIFSEWRTDSS